MYHIKSLDEIADDRAQALALLAAEAEAEKAAKIEVRYAINTPALSHILSHTTLSHTIIYPLALFHIPHLTYFLSPHLPSYPPSLSSPHRLAVSLRRRPGAQRRPKRNSRRWGSTSTY